MNDETLKKMLKKTIFLKVTTFKPTEDGETKKLEKAGEVITSIRRTVFLKDLYEANKIGNIEFVAAAPSEFALNKIYIRLDGKMVYTFVEAAATAEK